MDDKIIILHITNSPLGSGSELGMDLCGVMGSHIVSTDSDAASRIQSCVPTLTASLAHVKGVEVFVIVQRLLSSVCKDGPNIDGTRSISSDDSVLNPLQKLTLPPARSNDLEGFAVGTTIPSRALQVRFRFRLAERCLHRREGYERRARSIKLARYEHPPNAIKRVYKSEADAHSSTSLILHRSTKAHIESSPKDSATLQNHQRLLKKPLKTPTAPDQHSRK